MALTPEEVEERLIDLNEQITKLRQEGRIDSRIPLLATTFDVEDAILARTTIVRKEANETVTSSTTLQDDNDLLIALDAIEVCIFEAVIFCGGPSAADIKIAFTVPAGANIRWGAAGPLLGAGATHAQFGQVSSSGASISFDTEVGVDRSIHIRGLVVNGATAGDLQMQWAQVTSDGTPVTVFDNSWLRREQIR